MNPYPEFREFTRHTFHCSNCGTETRASKWRLASLRKGDPEASDAELARQMSWCLSCWLGTPVAGEHVDATVSHSYPGSPQQSAVQDDGAATEAPTAPTTRSTT